MSKFLEINIVGLDHKKRFSLNKDTATGQVVTCLLNMDSVHVIYKTDATLTVDNKNYEVYRASASGFSNLYFIFMNEVSEIEKLAAKLKPFTTSQQVQNKNNSFFKLFKK